MIRIAKTPLILMLSATWLLAGCPESADEDTPDTGNSTVTDTGGGSSDEDTGQNNADDTGSGDRDADSPSGDAGEGVDGGESDLTTYHGQLKPILDDNCVGCHTEGQIAPFPLRTYDEVAPLAKLLADNVASGEMPPWPPQEGCGDFQHERTLTAEEIQVFKDFVADGKKKGTPVGDSDGADSDGDEGAKKAGDISGFENPDLVVDPGFGYTPDPPNGGIDDYHCFIIDPELDQKRHVNGFHTLPGDASVVHHMLLYAVPASAAEDLKKRDEAEPDSPGFTCFGGAGGVDTKLLAGWTPGTVPIEFEEGAGIELKKDDLLVMQIHYNTVNNPEAEDRTKVQLKYTDGPAAKNLAIVPLADTEFEIAPGDANGKGQASFTLPIDLTIHGVFPHMHLLGTSIDFNAKMPGDKEKCLVDVPDWDFDWQGFYLYEKPVELPGGTTVTMNCSFDNSAANQPDGRKPRKLTWGEGTYDEMCLMYSIIELPPGVNL